MLHISTCVGFLPTCAGSLPTCVDSLLTCVDTTMDSNPLGWGTKKEKCSDVDHIHPASNQTKTFYFMPPAHVILIYSTKLTNYKCETGSYLEATNKMPDL